MAIRRLIASAFCLLALTLVADSASATGPDVPVEAMHFFSLGERAFDEDRLAEAEVLYLKALVIFPDGLGIRVTLGLCREQMGKLALAWETMREAAERAKTQATEAAIVHDFRARKHAREMQERAESAMKQIEPKVGWVKIDVAPNAAKVGKREVLRDGVRMRVAAMELLPVDAGTHTFVAREGMDRFWEQTVVISIAEHTVSAPKLLRIDDPRPPRESSHRALVGYIVGGVGLGAAVAGVTTLALGASEKTELVRQGRCTPSLDHCDEQLQTAADWRTASQKQITGGVLLGVGIAMVGIGLPLIIVSPKSDAAPAMSMFVGPTSIQLRGRF